MTPLFFAADRPTYSKLLSQHIADCLTYPTTILGYLRCGGFTVSITGRSWYGGAVDKGHEMLVKGQVVFNTFSSRMDTGHCRSWGSVHYSYNTFALTLQHAELHHVPAAVICCSIFSAQHCRNSHSLWWSWEAEESGNSVSPSKPSKHSTTWPSVLQ